METNVGTRKITQKGTMIGLEDEEWYDPEWTANIFSFLKVVDQGYKITCNSDKEDAFFIHKDKTIKFKWQDNLYPYNLPDKSEEHIKQVKDEQQQQFVEIVAEKRANYTTALFKEAKKFKSYSMS